MLCWAPRVTPVRLCAVRARVFGNAAAGGGEVVSGRGGEGIAQLPQHSCHDPPPPSPCRPPLATQHGLSSALLHNTKALTLDLRAGKRWHGTTNGRQAAFTVFPAPTEHPVTHAWSLRCARGYCTARDKGQLGSREEQEALVRMEVEMFRQRGFRVPSHISEDDFAEMLPMSSSRRRKFLAYLCKTEYKILSMERKREERRKASEEERLRQIEKAKENQHLHYGLWNNTMFLRINKATTNRFYNQRLYTAMQYGQPLVLDLSFEHKMNPQERESCSFQLQMLFARNRRHRDPYDLHLCNTRHSPDVMRRLHKHIPILQQPSFPMHTWEDCYLDHFPRHRLVYLTPHCREELLTYDHDAVYVVGAVVDKSSGDPMTLAKAKAQGVKMQRLPLERYLDWGIGNKCLTLNQIVAILNDIKLTGDWNQALRHVPRRKLAQPYDEEEAVQMLRRKFQRPNPARGPPNARKYKK